MTTNIFKLSSTKDAVFPYLLPQRHRIYVFIGLTMLLIAVIVSATAIGSIPISLTTIFQILISKLPWGTSTPDWSDGIETIIFQIRLPRIILAGLVGAALAVAGATYQGLFRNPLADPYLIGVSQGAMLGAVIGFLLPFDQIGGGLGLVPLLAFAGAIISVAIVYAIARVGKTIPVTTIILAGVALSGLGWTIF